MKKKKRIIFLLILTAAIFFGAKYFYELFLYRSLPVSYKEEILAASEDYDLSPYLLLAVIKSESNFQKDAVSPAGAVGLMQIMPSTFDWLQEKRGQNLKDEDLFVPEINIDYGAYYLAYLLEIFGDEELAVASYNAGQNNVLKWMESDEYYHEGKLIKIPFSETENYLKRIRRYKAAYESALTEKGWSFYEKRNFNGA